MRKTLAVLMMVGSLTAVPLGVLAGTPGAAAAGKGAKAEHATTGTIKSMSDTTLVQHVYALRLAQQRLRTTY